MFVSHNPDVEKGNLKVKRIKLEKSPALLQTQNENQTISTDDFMQIIPILNDSIILAQSSNTADSYPDTDRTHVASTSQLAGAASNQATVAIEDAPLETAEPVHDLISNSCIGTGKSK